MRNLTTILIATLAAISLTWTTATVARAAGHVCTGVVGAQRFENLEVPAGASCTLNGTQVDGNITVASNASLLASGVIVGGNIQADGATDVIVNNDSSVGGDVQVKQGGGATVNGVRVTGNVQLESNSSALSVLFNEVGGDVQVFQNRGGATINDNRIDGNLQCKENNPVPTGGRNQAASFEDQCAGFAGTPVTPGATPTPPTPAPTGTPPTPIPDGGNGVCQGSIGAQRFENLEVPAGASCTLNGTQVDGNITVASNATLHAIEVIVGGNIQADGATDVIVNNNSSVGGDVQVKQGGGATVNGVRVTGNIQLESNSSALSVLFNEVGGDVQVFQNRGGATINDNRIDGNLQCKENNPAPTGGRNQAASFEDQCAGFAGTPVTPGATPTPPTPAPTGTPPTPIPDGGNGVCQGSIGAQRFENLEVPAGASCTLNGTQVDGNITVASNATLHAIEVIVGGNIQADGAANVTVSNNSSVGGSIQIERGGSAALDRVNVTGDIQVESNLSALSITFNWVGGNMQVFQNRGGATINDNRIDGNLQCKENNPAPTGGRNQAASFEDQCAGFAGAPIVPPAPTPAPGSNRVVCQGSIGAESYEHLEVPAGATCSLLGTQVSGDVIVGAGATLQASGLAVAGHLQAQGAADVTVNNNSSVGGNLLLSQGGSATVDQVLVAGDLLLEANNRSLSVMRNQVGGNLRIVGNQAGVVVRSNAVDGALQCQENSLAPLGGANQASSLEAQCAELNMRIFLPSIAVRR